MFDNFILVQERLTKQIATAIIQAVHPTGVGVVVEARYRVRINLYLL
jgi:GTP cyclohydrolase I